MKSIKIILLYVCVELMICVIKTLFSAVTLIFSRWMYLMKHEIYLHLQKSNK